MVDQKVINQKYCINEGGVLEWSDHELRVSKIKEGTVIDHINSGSDVGSHQNPGDQRS